MEACRKVSKEKGKDVSANSRSTQELYERLKNVGCGQFLQDVRAYLADGTMLESHPGIWRSTRLIDETYVCESGNAMSTMQA